MNLTRIKDNLHHIECLKRDISKLESELVEVKTTKDYDYVIHSVEISGTSVSLEDMEEFTQDVRKKIEENKDSIESEPDIKFYERTEEWTSYGEDFWDDFVGMQATVTFVTTEKMSDDHNKKIKNKIEKLYKQIEICKNQIKEMANET